MRAPSLVAELIAERSVGHHLIQLSFINRRFRDATSYVFHFIWSEMERDDIRLVLSCVNRSGPDWWIHSNDNLFIERLSAGGYTHFLSCLQLSDDQVKLALKTAIQN